ncbi:hypothetical protein AGLY_003578 [Aphis glycines]|uniref:Uncharacterized protein n=1 Tax=Aphis glycines TaxID=307491 RepID=A0A6G0TZZ4_APHGL|nr:hypothetical protein AGLY_003578 [Aphis glycines]
MQIHCSLEILSALLCEIILKNLKCDFIKKKNSYYKFSLRYKSLNFSIIFYFFVVQKLLQQINFNFDLIKGCSKGLGYFYEYNILYTYILKYYSFVGCIPIIDQNYEFHCLFVCVAFIKTNFFYNNECLMLRTMDVLKLHVYVLDIFKISNMDNMINFIKNKNVVKVYINIVKKCNKKEHKTCNKQAPFKATKIKKLRITLMVAVIVSSSDVTNSYILSLQYKCMYIFFRLRKHLISMCCFSFTNISSNKFGIILKQTKLNKHKFTVVCTFKMKTKHVMRHYHNSKYSQLSSTHRNVIFPSMAIPIYLFFLHSQYFMKSYFTSPLTLSYQLSIFIKLFLLSLIINRLNKSTSKLLNQKQNILNNNQY